METEARVATTRQPLLDLKATHEPMACISTAHITEKTANALGQDQGKSGDPALWSTISYVFFHEYGWIIYCSEDAAAAVRNDHPELATLIEQCLASGAQFLRLDCDGHQVDGLTTFTW